MNVSLEQIVALDGGDAVPVVIDGRDCVLIRRDVFERTQEEEVDVKSMQGLLADLDAEDWEDAANYESQ